MTFTASNLLQTKLRPPLPTGPVIVRPALLERLDQSASRPLTLISAPAGAGKTRLVLEWLKARKQHVGWISLDKADANPTRFLAYLVAAVRSQYPEAATASEMMLNLPGPLSAASVSDALLQDLEALPGPLRLVLDDYHAAEGGTITVR